jgi:septal ring factor EnvC (AmiA/AmiB activator)
MPPPPPATNNDAALRQIQAAWDEAQMQLKVLREQVDHVTALAQSKVASNMLERDMDRAYRDLGEAVWAEVSKGRLQLPNNLSTVRKALEAVTNRIQAQNASINDLLAEGADIARRLQEKMQAPSKPVAPQLKRR